MNYTYIHELNNYRKEKELLDYKKRNEEPVISTKMDTLLKITKKEEENATRIQRYYRKVMRKRYYEFIKDKIPLVIHIQSVFRGYITRKVVKKFIVTKVYYVIMIQVYKYIYIIILILFFSLFLYIFFTFFTLLFSLFLIFLLVLLFSIYFFISFSFFFFIFFTFF